MRPGIVSKDAEGKLTCKPILSRIVSLLTETNDLQYAVPGGLIGRSQLHCIMVQCDNLNHFKYNNKTRLFHPKYFTEDEYHNSQYIYAEF